MEFELQLLGRFRLIHHDHGPLRVPPGRLRALLALLAFRPGDTHTRGELAGLIWSGHPEQDARHSLNQALSQLRRIAGKELFVKDGEQLALDPELATSDLQTIRYLLHDGSTDALRYAMELCVGPFLEGIDLDMPEFEEWLQQARAEAVDLEVAIYESLIVAIPASEDPSGARLIAERLVRIDPLNERGYRTLIESATVSGEIDRAIRIYETLRARLANELGVAPGEETQRMVERISPPRVDVVNERANPCSSSSRLPTVFVAPFRLITNEHPAPVVSNTLTHDVITELGRFRSLAVIAAESALACYHYGGTLDGISRYFDADYVLTGTLRSNTTSVRLNVQLHESHSGAQCWSEKYDCSLGELFEIHDDVVAKVVGTVANCIEHEHMRRARRKPMHSWAAYDYFLRALDIYYHRWSAPDAPRECKLLFQKSVELDPDFARGHAFRACEAHMAQTEQVDENFGVSIRHAQRATMIDPMEADGYRSLGAIYMIIGEYDESYRHLLHGIQLNPGYADLVAQLSRYYSLAGEPARALSEIERARHLNPLHRDWYWLVAAMAHYGESDYTSALAAIRRMQETTAMEHLYAAACHVGMREMAQANDRVRRALADMPQLNCANVGLYLPYKDTDRRDEIVHQLASAGLPRRS